MPGSILHYAPRVVHSSVSARPGTKGSAGFSLVELVVVVLLLGILGLVVLSRFANSSSFRAAAVEDGIIAVARSAQQMAMGRSGVSFNIQQTASGWEFSAAENMGDIIREMSIDGGGIVLTTGSSHETSAHCGDPAFATAVNDLEVVFDGFGNILEFSNGGTLLENDPALINGVRVCVNGAERPVCISPGGFAHEGDCDA